MQEAIDLVSARKAFESYVSSHVETVSEYEALKMGLEEAEIRLKEALKLSGESLELPEIKTRYTVIQPYKRWVDYSEARSACDGQALELLNSISTIEVDPKLFEKAVQSGELPNACRTALHEDKMPMRITKSEI